MRTVATADASIANPLVGACLRPATTSAANSDTVKTGIGDHCLADHQAGEGPSPGDGPLFSIKANFPDRDRLCAQDRGVHKTVPAARMPPVGKHEALTKAGVDATVGFFFNL
jgi:hypothetical protein